MFLSSNPLSGEGEASRPEFMAQLHCSLTVLPGQITEL